ncbi:MAG: CocE/NonD family hydrolase, partial [Planctomycetaceae bacterium]
VIQDCRGCYQSGGEVNFLFPEAEDGYDTLAWIDQQPWSNGRVGTWGTSWMGWTQTAMAALGPKNLVAMVPNMSGADAHQCTVRQGGAMELRFIAWAFWHSATNTQAELKQDPWVDQALNLGAAAFHDWLTRMPIRPGQTQLALVPAYERWALEILTHSDRDEYWKHPSVCPREHWDNFSDAATLIVGGWYDSYTRATFDNFIGLSERNRNVQLLVGPWTHGSIKPELSFAGDVEFGHDAALDSFRDVHLDWFDRHVKNDERNTGDGEAPVRIFIMGGGSGKRTTAGRLMHGGRWRDEQEWPLARTHYTPYFLHADGTLSLTQPADTDSSTTYRFDPSNPVPSNGGNISSLAELGSLPAGIGDPAFAPRDSRMAQILEPGGFDQVEHEGLFGCQPPYLPLGSRPDVLVFQTDPLEDDLEVTGPITVTLWVKSSAVDTDFTAKLLDVYPPSNWYPRGYALNLSDSIMRLRYRRGPEREEFLPQEEIDQVTITLYPTSNLFARGHRLRLDVSSSNYPRFDVNPNTGEPIGRDRRKTAADNTVFHDATRCSQILLPVIPR